MNKLKIKLYEMGISNKALAQRMGVREQALSNAGRASDYVALEKKAMETLKEIENESK